MTIETHENREIDFLRPIAWLSVNLGGSAYVHDRTTVLVVGKTARRVQTLAGCKHGSGAAAGGSISGDLWLLRDVVTRTMT